MSARFASDRARQVRADDAARSAWQTVPWLVVVDNETGRRVGPVRFVDRPAAEAYRARMQRTRRRSYSVRDKLEGRAS